MFDSSQVDLINFVKSRGHVLTFAFLLFIPAYSCDLTVKSDHIPTPDHSNYLVSLNKQIEIFGNSNPLHICFSNRVVGLSANHKNIKYQDWEGYSSTAPPHLRLQNCHSYTLPVLVKRSKEFFSHGNSLVNAIL